MERELLLYLGRASAELEMRISLPGRSGRRYELVIERKPCGARYFMGLAGRRSTQVDGVAVLEALTWLGVKRQALRDALQRAVVEQTLLHDASYWEGRELLDVEGKRRLDSAKAVALKAPNIFELGHASTPVEPSDLTEP